MQAPGQVPVVHGPPPRIRERLIRLLHPYKPPRILHREIRRRDVGVVLPGHLLVRLLDLRQAHALRYAQQLVEARVRARRRKPIAHDRHRLQPRRPRQAYRLSPRARGCGRRNRFGEVGTAERTGRAGDGGRG